MGSEGCLTDRERNVLRLRFGLDDGRHRTLWEVAESLNISRERARLLERRAMRKLMNAFAAMEQPIPILQCVLRAAPSCLPWDERQWVRANNALRRNHIETVADLLDRRAPELLSLRGIGRRTAAEIRRVVHAVGLRLRDEEA